MGSKALRGRALLAVMLMIAYYVLSCAMVAGLTALAIGLLLTVKAGGLVGIVIAGCLAGAGLIAWSMIPRVDRFEPPGPEITASSHPDLFAELRKVIDETGVEGPAHVYLTIDVNAGVSQRGGIMGFGSKRVMAIGIPLMYALRVDELRAVLAHEMGHFHGGDVKLGPWIYKTRAALARTLMSVGKLRAQANEVAVFAGVLYVVQLPFRAFFAVYMRITQAISRAQEYAADAMAVRTEGRRALVDGLTKTSAASIGFALYMENQFLPLALEKALMPPLGEGFARYMERDAMKKLGEEVVAQELTSTHDPYDSHPPLGARIEAARGLPDRDDKIDARPAILLVPDAAKFETAEAAARLKRTLQPIEWRDTGAAWIALWREYLEPLRGALAQVRLATFPTEAEPVCRLLGAEPVSPEVLPAWGSIVGQAFALILVEEGFTPEVTRPGEIAFRRGEVVVEPFAEIRQRVSGDMTAGDWLVRVAELGLVDRPLSGSSSASAAL